MTMDILSYFMILFGLVPYVALEFICTRGGRLKNPDDPSFRSYYLCRKLRNGTYLSKLYQCPTTTLFNPEIELCSEDYKPEPTPPDDFQCSQRGRFPDPTDESCQRYYLCSMLRNGSFIKTAYSCPKTTYFNPGLQQCSVHYQCPTKTTTDTPIGFVCSSKGRFKDPEDLSCTVYFLCSQLRNGTFIKTKYKCPNYSLFDPDAAKCSIGYTCIDGCISATMSSSPAALITDDIGSILSTTSAILTPLITTDTSTTSTPDSMITDDGTTSSSDTRPDTTRDSSNSMLTDDADDSPTYSIIDDSSSSSESIMADITNTDSTNHISYITSASSESMITDYYEDTTSTSSDSTTFDGIISTTGAVPAPTTIEDEFTCTENGRFQDVEDTICKNYFLCSDLRNGTFIKTKYVCPKNSRFDPEAGMCSAFYTCPRTTTQAGGTTKKHCRRLKKGPRFAKAVTFVCSEKGRFRDPDDNTCEFYYLCSQLHSGAFVSAKYRCPEGSGFDPELGRCSAVYVCPRSTTASAEAEYCEDTGDDDYTEETGRTKRSNETTLHLDGDEEDGSGGSTTTVKGDTSTGGEDVFVCSDKGRFPDLTDANCERYFLCSRLLNGTFIKTKYKCPSSTYFDPIFEKCSPVYQCWNMPSTSNSFENSDYSDSEIEQTSFPGGYLGTTLDLDNFICNQEGRFPDPEDITCKRYFLCSHLHNGTFIGTEFQCPVDTLFDPILQTCSPDYQCPYQITLITDYDSFEVSTEDEFMYTDGDGDNYSMLSTRFGNSSPLFKTTTSDVFNKTVTSINGLTKEDETMHTNDNSDPSRSEVTYPSTNASFSGTTESSESTIHKESTEEDETSIDVTHDTTLSENLGNTVTATDADIFNRTENLLSSSIRGEDSSEPSSTERTGQLFTDNINSTDVSSKSSIEDNFLTTHFGIVSTTSTTIPEETSISASSDDTIIYTIITEPAEGSHPPQITTAGYDSECGSLQFTIPTFDFQCEQSGRFADPNDTTMKQYFLCSRLRNGTFMQILFQCPQDTYFNAAISKCSNVKMTTLCSSRSTESYIQTTLPSEDFVCLKEGLFPDLSDETNTQYFECILIGNDIFNTTHYKCPMDLIFDPLQQVCLAQFESSTNYRTKRSDEYSSTVKPIDVTSTTNSDVIIGHTVGKYFACKARGYYKDYEDPTGVSYYYCDIASDGRLFQYLLKCPDSYFYNTENNLCTPVGANMLT